MKSCRELAHEFTYWDACQRAGRLIYLKDCFFFLPLLSKGFQRWHGSNGACSWDLRKHLPKSSRSQQLRRKTPPVARNNKFCVYLNAPRGKKGVSLKLQQGRKNKLKQRNLSNLHKDTNIEAINGECFLVMLQQKGSLQIWKDTLKLYFIIDFLKTCACRWTASDKEAANDLVTI